MTSRNNLDYIVESLIGEVRETDNIINTLLNIEDYNKAYEFYVHRKLLYNQACNIYTNSKTSNIILSYYKRLLKQPK